MKKRDRLILFLVLLAGKLSAQITAVEVHLDDYARLQPSTFQRLVTQTQKILAETGLSIQMKACERSLPISCESQTGKTRYLVVRVVANGPTKMKNVMRPPLGQSFADHDGGTYASVFLERVQNQAASADVPLLNVLAYATAHEIGHLLLGNEAHTPRGVMKGTWDRKDYEAMKQNYLHFSKEQVRQLRSRYSTATRVANPQLTELTDEVEHCGVMGLRAAWRF
jgi:hypothetical protein